MAILPAAPLMWLDRQFRDADGTPLAGGKLYSYEAGTATALALYTDVDLTSAYSNPMVLDADGRPPSDEVFLQPQGYKFILTDADDVQIWTIDNYEDVGQVAAENAGVLASAGGKDQVSGYAVTVADRLVTMDSTGGPNPCLVNLPAASDASQDVTIKNNGTVALSIVPDGLDSIDELPAAYAVAASASPLFRAVTLRPDGVSGWYVVASVGV